MKTFKILAAILLALMIAGAALSSLTWINRETQNYDEHQTFGGEEVGAVRILGSSTDLNLLPSNDDSVHIDFTGQVIRGGFGGGEYQLLTDLQGDVLTVEVTRDSKFQIGLFDERDLRLDVRVPKKLYQELSVTASSGDIQTEGLHAEQVTLHTSSGDIQADGLQGQKLRFTTSSGDQELQNLTGKLLLESSSGTIALRTWAGEAIEASTSSGDQRLFDLTGKVRAHSSSGDIRLGMSALHDTLDLLTSSGDVEMQLPDSAYYKLHFNSSSGSSAIDFPMEVQARDDHQLIAAIGEGGPDVRVETASGDLSIIKQ